MYFEDGNEPSLPNVDTGALLNAGAQERTLYFYNKWLNFVADSNTNEGQMTEGTDTTKNTQLGLEFMLVSQVVMIQMVTY